MKFNKIIAIALLFGADLSPSFAAEELPMLINLDEVEVRSSRENTALRHQPVAYSLISAERIERTNINSLHELSAIVPNFVMPDYGSKITSSIFVRGIGSRMGEPSVGLYVDDIPYLDKSAFDFNFFDIRSIEFLRGPQGTFYGRNAIGGLIRINTLSPFDYHGTRFFASYGTANDQIIRLSHYQKLNDKLAVSLAGYYHANDGFFKNEFSGKKDWQESFGARLRLEWRLNSKWNMNFSAVYDNSFQLAFPYAPFDIETDEIGAISYDEKGSYRREMFNAGLSIQHRSENVLFTSATSFQYIDDQMKIDQDFTSEPIFSLTQNQKINALTQEIVFRSRNQSDYQWTTGAFGFYKNSDVDAPVTFRKGGLDMIQKMLDDLREENPRMPAITITNEEMLVPGIFKIPAYGLALYHQFSYTFWDKLTVTGGLRLEYEKTDFDYNTYAELHTVVQLPNPMIPPIKADSTYTIKGKTSQDFFAVLPKIALKYDINEQHSIYASVSRGHKTGGFNFQMFSDILRDMMQGKEMEDVENIISYKPEFTTNYEIGLRSQLIPTRFFLDLAVFYIDYTNQQIVTFSSANTGNRRMENAGRSENMGAEATVRARITDNLNTNIAYGFTHATFKEYNDGKNDFAGNFIPLVPRNTFSAGFEYTVGVENFRPLQFVVFRIQYNGLGKIYFTEENLVSQDFYGTLNGSISFEKGNFRLNFWTKNALNAEFKTFYFTSLDNHFVQRGRPRQIGVSMQYNF